jgi:membrane protein involved in colicin uptake
VVAASKKRVKEALREALKKAREVQVQREVKQALDDMVAQLVEGDRAQRRTEQTNKRRGHNSACGVENKRRQSGRWQNNYYGHWEQWTERQ